MGPHFSVGQSCVCGMTEVKEKQECGIVAMVGRVTVSMEVTVTRVAVVVT